MILSSYKNVLILIFMQQIQNLMKFSLHKMKDIDPTGHQYQNTQAQECRNQCQLCLNEYTRVNHPMKICFNDHNMCQKCVEQKLFLQSQNKNQLIGYCPFCKSRIDQRKIVVNYKLLNSLKKLFVSQNAAAYQNILINQSHQVSCFQKLSQQNYRLILSFLYENQKIQLSSANLFLRSLLMTDQIWGEFYISDCINMNLYSQNHKQNWKNRLKWISKYFSVIKPHQVKLIIRDQNEDKNLLQFFLDNYSWVKKLTLVCQSQDIHLTVAKACTKVNYLSASSQVFSDELFQIMAKTMKEIRHFQVLKDDSYFTAKNISKYFPEGLQSIILKPHMVEFDEISLLVNQNPQNLTKIQLDIEYCQEETLIKILQPLTNVEILKLYHLQNIHIPEKLANSLSDNVREIFLTKAYQLPVDLIIQKIVSPKLLTIDFTEVNLLNDDNIYSIAKQCPYLKRLNISWCTKVSQDSISNLIQSCLYLQYLNLTGLKYLTDKVFVEYLELVPIFKEDHYDLVKDNIFSLIQAGKRLENVNSKTTNFFKIENEIELLSKITQIKTLRKLKQLTCLSCNGVNDSILKIIYLINRQANTVNYYGNCMGLYTNQDMFGSM